MPNRSITWLTISRCWPVSTTRVRKSAACWKARITGASLIASGLVPSTIVTRGFATAGVQMGGS